MSCCRSLRPTGRVRARNILGLFACGLLASLAWAAGAGADAPRSFDVPAGDAVETLKLAARQGGLEIIFFAETVRGVRTSAVRGAFHPRDALVRLVANTGLVVVPNEKNGTLTINRAPQPAPPPTPSPTHPQSTPPSQAHSKPMKRKNPLAFIGAWLALALAPAPVGLAAEAGGSLVSALPKPTDETVQLDPFVVNQQTTKGYAATSSLSATRINTPVREIPATINIVTKEFMADFGRTTVEQAIQQVGGVANRARSEGHFQEFYMIRGFNSTLNLKNRVPYNIFTDASLVEQIEVVKGPQTVLYGLADPGGLVNIITKKPLSARRSELGLKFGSEDFRRLEWDTTGPALASGALLYRLTGSFEKSKSWLKNGRSEQTFLTPAITARPFQNTKIDLEYTYQHRNHTFQRPQLPQDAANTRHLYPNRYFSTITPDDDTTVDGRAVEFNLTQRFVKNVTARATFAQVARDSDMFNFVGSIAQPVLTNGVRTGYRFTPIANIEDFDSKNRHYYVDVNVSDIRFAGTRHNFVFGFQQDESRGGSSYTTRLADPAAAFDPLAPPAEIRLTVKRDQLRARTDLRQGQAFTGAMNRGWFVIDQAKAWDNRLSVLGGLRHDDLQVGGKRTTPQIGANFEWMKGLYVYGLYSESFVPNNERFDVGLNQLRQFDPTESKGYDIGTKAELFDGKLSGSVAYFNIKRSNVVQTYPAVPVPPGIPQFFLSGLEGSEGVEVEIYYTPSEAWQFILSYAHTDARILESNRSTDVGLQLAQTSPDAFSVITKHSVLRGALKGLSLGALVIHRAGPIPEFSTYGNRLLVDDSWTRLDLFAAYDAKVFGVPAKFSLNVNNVTDTVYQERQGMLNAPRQVFLQTRLKF